MNISRISFDDTKPKKLRTAATKLTRSQLAKKAELEAEPKSLVDGIGQSADEQEPMKEEYITSDENPTITATETEQAEEMASSEPVPDSMLDAPTSPLPNAVPKVIANLRADTPAKRSTSNKENLEPEQMPSPQAFDYDTLEKAAVTVTSPPGPSHLSTSRPEYQIEALDELDDAVENANKDIPEVQMSSPEKPKGKDSLGRRDSKKPAPVVRTTRASQARISMAHNTDAAKKAPALGKPSPSKALARASSVREPATKRVISDRSSKGAKETAEGENKEAVIPHSKPRPFSMSFPAPPPPPKSTKAPTQSTFQLPGEAVAAKLKAAREARQQREAEEEEKKKSKVFKARPVPASLSKAPSVRQTKASEGRESVMNRNDLKTSTSALAAGHNRANSIATTRPTAPRSRVVSKEASKPAVPNGKPTSSELAVKKRPSTALANMSKPRTSIFGTTGPSALSSSTTTRAPSNPSKPMAKGKEVFNRPAAAKAAAEKEKHEKEAAAKKARADAADRGRQASREWAEKQKQKKLAAAKGSKEQDAEAQPQVTSPIQETAPEIESGETAVEA